jgi:hypothetical protein
MLRTENYLPMGVADCEGSDAGASLRSPRTAILQRSSLGLGATHPASLQVRCFEAFGISGFLRLSNDPAMRAADALRRAESFVSEDMLRRRKGHIMFSNKLPQLLIAE